MKPGQTYSSYKVNVIEDKSGNKTGFLTNGYLLYMSNHLNQTIQVSYNGANITIESLMVQEENLPLNMLHQLLPVLLVQMVS